MEPDMQTKHFIIIFAICNCLRLPSVYKNGFLEVREFYDTPTKHSQYDAQRRGFSVPTTRSALR